MKNYGELVMHYINCNTPLHRSQICFFVKVAVIGYTVTHKSQLKIEILFFQTNHKENIITEPTKQIKTSY